MITLTFPDSSKKEFKKGITGMEIAKGIGERLAQAAIAVEINSVIFDLSRPLLESGTFRILTFKDDKGKEVFWHSAAHVLAQAVKRIFPECKLTIGPPVEDGFYYDIDAPKPFSEEDLSKLEEEMKKITSEDHAIKRLVVSGEEARKKVSERKESYKVEMIDDLGDEQLTMYEQGEFIDLCRGPHVHSTGRIKAIKLTKLAGAYWRGDAKNRQLQRIYGVAFPSKDELKDYLHKLEEAKKRDHRVLTRDLDLVMFHEYAPGAPFFLEKGTVIYNELISFIRDEYKKRGYVEVITPQLYNKKLWETSGHWEHYREDMFILNIEGEEHSLKPMNCPSHCLIYNRSIHSYKELPMRIADFCNLHRNELSGTLSGMVRVRKFAQDDAHIFCRMDQVESEVLGVLEFIKYVWEEVFNFKLTYYLSTRPEKALGEKDTWDRAESMLKSALAKAKIPYTIKEGDGAFYGPKIDIDLEDALGRKWQCPTCQLDFNLPHRFKTTYEGEDGKKHEAVMIHRAVLGSLERFFAMLTEHYAGKFPLWISPIQVRVISIADRHIEYAKSVVQTLKNHGIRADLNAKADTVNYKVRSAQQEKINYIIVVGDKEIEDKTITVRTRDNQVHPPEKVDDFIAKLQKEIGDKK